MYLCPRISYAKFVKEFPDIEFASYDEISYGGVSKYYYLSTLVSSTSDNEEYATKLFSDVKQDIYGRLMFFITSGCIGHIRLIDQITDTLWNNL